MQIVLVLVLNKEMGWMSKYGMHPTYPLHVTPERTGQYNGSGRGWGILFICCIFYVHINPNVYFMNIISPFVIDPSFPVFYIMCITKLCT